MVDVSCIVKPNSFFFNCIANLNNVILAMFTRAHRNN